ncbi:MAG TPA: zf-HC2 domain-containing protein [Patescibacteria group bacterium]|nr:zf-HC2 domain-containing protein [Patescibacteria group bacterium]
MNGDRIDDGCLELRALLPAWIRDELDETRRQEVRRHLAGCAACREQAAETDPSVLFLGLEGRPLRPEFWQGFDAALRARIQGEQATMAGRLAGWAERFRIPRLAYVTIPAAMLLVVAGTLILSRPGFRGPGHPPVASGIPSPYERPIVPRAGSPAARPEVQGTLPAAWPIAGQASDPPALEEVGSAAARVYRFDGAGEDPTTIYFVVDETINF